MGHENVTIEVIDRVQVIKFDRQEKKNALTQGMYMEIGTALLEADSNPDIRVSVLSGAGDEFFTSGNDVKEFLARKSDDDAQGSAKFLSAVVTMEKPLIAAVNGKALGIGVTMLLHCDLVYAADHATFRAPFVNLGLIPEAGTSLLFPLRMSHQQASEINLLAEELSAEKAREFGFVNEVLPGDQVLEKAMASAKIIAAKPPKSIRLTKALFKKADRQAVLDRIEEERAHYIELLQSGETKEAINAILEKRPADFSKFE